MNHYNDLTVNQYGLNCGGDGDGGLTQSYQSGDPPNLSQCRDLCNQCPTQCGGFVDMLEERKCYFVSQVEHTKIQITDVVDIRRKYFNKVYFMHS